eukprot:SAG31_NODE_1273_length_9057_cov_13.364103_11_plen_80_part_01
MAPQIAVRKQQQRTGFLGAAAVGATAGDAPGSVFGEAAGLKKEKSVFSALAGVLPVLLLLLLLFPAAADDDDDDDDNIRT